MILKLGLKSPTLKLILLVVDTGNGPNVLQKQVFISLCNDRIKKSPKPGLADGTKKSSELI